MDWVRVRQVLVEHPMHLSLELAEVLALPAVRLPKTELHLVSQAVHWLPAPVPTVR